ncbi:alpha/beta fold hydrolase [Aestuariibacter halophilus]|uniref:Alpha/beta fold hydrolase n=1 Tax=Fluctibacter halophilus TaxID=226011 RepID=A0ABS8GCV7_9ALTE|nr:alpha/beta fold hydrolase [Aestuariibacter halophilus]MCC2618086.1 alpha/beta fold hydrolase [Aestuariibacter halophilus]
MLRVLTLSLLLLHGATLARTPDWLAPFVTLYEQQLGQAEPCALSASGQLTVCSPTLLNNSIGPFVLHHGQPQGPVVVLLHGLSDSPFFLRSIAPAIHQQGMTVIVGLLPGHGKHDADADMEDEHLSDRWRTHLSALVGYAKTLGQPVLLGGFSTGGALVTEYTLQHPGEISGLLLFSGALALDDSAESLSHFWGMGWLARLLDGEYQTRGPNPYKYPSVSSYSAIELMEVIDHIRELQSNEVPLNVPIFAAHSLADTTTPYHGVASLLDYNRGDNLTYLVDESVGVCHADLVINPWHLEQMDYNATKVDSTASCKVPRANPEHDDMLNALALFLQRFASTH